MRGQPNTADRRLWPEMKSDEGAVRAQTHRGLHRAERASNYHDKGILPDFEA